MATTIPREATIDPIMVSIPGRNGTRRELPITASLRDSDTVFATFEDPMYGDFRWNKGTDKSTKLGYRKLLKHPVYCPRGKYYHPVTNRLVKIYSEDGIRAFIVAHNLFCPYFNEGSNRSI